MKKPTRAGLLMAAGTALVALFWKELPAARRYLTMKRM